MYHGSSLKVRVLAFGLALSILASANTIWAASVDTFIEQDAITVEDRSLADFAIHLKNDPMATQINFNGADLSYVMTDGTFVTMSETVGSDGTRVWTINQQGSVDILQINAAKSEIKLNDIPVHVDTVPTTTIQSRNTMADNWHVMGSASKYHVQLETYVRTATVSALHALIFAALGPVGTALSIVQAIINVAIAYNSTSTALFISRQMYRDDFYLKYKYEDDYYFDSKYTEWAYNNVTIVLSANR